MANRTPINLPFGQVDTSLVAPQWFPVTGWIPAGGIGNLRAVMEMRGRFGNASVAPAYQTCGLDTTNPDAAIIIPIENDSASGYADADGMWELNTTATTPAVANKFQIRFGWLVKAGTAGTAAGARVGGLVEVMT